MAELERFEWVCPMCSEKILAFTSASFETIKRIHIENHHKVWVGKGPYDVLTLFKGRYEAYPGEWHDWDDYLFMKGLKIDVLTADLRTQDELGARYRPKERDYDGGMADDQC